MSAAGDPWQIAHHQAVFPASPLPIEVHVAERASRHRPDAPEALLPSPLLVVEDEPMMQVRLRSILPGLGYAQDALFSSGRSRRPEPCS